MDRARRRWFALGVVAAAVCLSHGRGVSADGFPGYQYLHAFNLLAGASVFDVLNDGRLIVLVGADVYVETAADSHSFSQTGTLLAADFPSFGAAFIRVSPTGTKIAIGNNGGASFSNYQVGVFDVNTIAGVWFVAGHFDGEWINDTHIALTAGDFVTPSVVTALDTASPNPSNPVNFTIVDNIGGASAGITFDSAGNLYTGNGFQTAGPSGTGAVKAFANAAWTAALDGGPPLDFEADGVLIVDVLSASPLAFDGNGNLIVGGGDFSNSADYDFVALVRASAVADALGGMGPADPENPDEVWRLDPDKANAFNFFSAIYDPTLGRLYVRDGGGPVHSYVDVSTIPTVSQWGLTSMTLLLMTAGTLILRRSGLRRSMSVMGSLRIWILLLVSSANAIGEEESPFATTVLEFAPAPGQFVNHPDFSDPRRALGPPSGGGTSAPNNTSVVSLGGFGGYIVLRFDHTVVDDPLNPFGMDAIVFGNAYWVGGNPNRHWAECATIEISVDENGNGLADDAWYLIAGSHVTNPESQLATAQWDDDIKDDRFPPDDESWIPVGYSGTWETEAFALPVVLFGATVVTNPTANGNSEGIYGYGDYSPTLILGDLNGDGVVDDATRTPGHFYTTPDDPRRVGMTTGSGGGDAFDIAWAIDPNTGAAAELPGFDFIRLTSAVDSVSPLLGEKSTEIDAVADVAPDPFGDADDDGDIDLADAAYFQNCFGVNPNAAPECARVDREPNLVVNVADAAAFIERMTGPL